MTNVNVLDDIKLEFLKLEKNILYPMYCIGGILLFTAIFFLIRNSNLNTPNSSYPSILITIKSLLFIFTLLFLSRKKKMILENYGYKCKNCNKTPRQFQAELACTSGFCPHCQLKYDH